MDTLVLRKPPRRDAPPLIRDLFARVALFERRLRTRFVARSRAERHRGDYTTVGRSRTYDSVQTAIPVVAQKDATNERGEAV